MNLNCVTRGCKGLRKDGKCLDISCKKRITGTEREDLIKKIENNDPEVLGKLADLILMQEGSPVLTEVKCTTETLNKIIRDKVKK